MLFIDQLLKAFIGPAFASVIVTVGWFLFIIALLVVFLVLIAAALLSRPAMVLSVLFVLLRRDVFIDIEAVVHLCVVPLVGAGVSCFISSAEFQRAVPHPVAKVDQHTCRMKRWGQLRPIHTKDDGCNYSFNNHSNCMRTGCASCDYNINNIKEYLWNHVQNYVFQLWMKHSHSQNPPSLQSLRIEWEVSRWQNSSVQLI